MLYPTVTNLMSKNKFTFVIETKGLLVFLFFFLFFFNNKHFTFSVKTSISYVQLYTHESLCLFPFKGTRVIFRFTSLKVSFSFLLELNLMFVHALILYIREKIITLREA